MELFDQYWHLATNWSVTAFNSLKIHKKILKKKGKTCHFNIYKKGHKKLCIHSYLFSLQLPSKHSPFIAIHQYAVEFLEHSSSGTSLYNKTPTLQMLISMFMESPLYITIFFLQCIIHFPLHITTKIPHMKLTRFQIAD